MATARVVRPPGLFFRDDVAGLVMSLALSGGVTSQTANQPDAGTLAFTDRSSASRYFIGAVIAAGIGALFMQPPGASYAHPAVFLTLLSAAAVASVFKV